MFTSFVGSLDGPWEITSADMVCGLALNAPDRVSIIETQKLQPYQNGTWRLTGVAGYVRYVERREKTELTDRQAGLGRTEATCAALIPISKSAAWWELTQEERREIFEGQSRHIAGSMKYLPAVARQLYHCRDLGQPFDFLTWFEFAPEHSKLFDELLVHLRTSAEWAYVEREVDIRLSRTAA